MTAIHLPWEDCLLQTLQTLPAMCQDHNLTSVFGCAGWRHMMLCHNDTARQGFVGCTPDRSQTCTQNQIFLNCSNKTIMIASCWRRIHVPQGHMTRPTWSGHVEMALECMLSIAGIAARAWPRMCLLKCVLSVNKRCASRLHAMTHFACWAPTTSIHVLVTAQLRHGGVYSYKPYPGTICTHAKAIQ